MSLCRFFRPFGAFAFRYDGHPPLARWAAFFRRSAAAFVPAATGCWFKLTPRCALLAKLRHRLVGRTARPSLRGIGLSYRRNSRVGAPPISTSVKERLEGNDLRGNFRFQVSRFQRQNTVQHWELGAAQENLHLMQHSTSIERTL